MIELSDLEYLPIDTVGTHAELSNIYGGTHEVQSVALGPLQN
jgi:hypothetical protein